MLCVRQGGGAARDIRGAGPRRLARALLPRAAPLPPQQLQGKRHTHIHRHTQARALLPRVAETIHSFTHTRIHTRANSHAYAYTRVRIHTLTISLKLVSQIWYRYEQMRAIVIQNNTEGTTAPPLTSNRDWIQRARLLCTAMLKLKCCILAFGQFNFLKIYLIDKGFYSDKFAANI